MALFEKPSAEQIQVLLAAQGPLAFSYVAVGATEGGSPPGFDLDHHRTPLGQGPGVFEAARLALRRWAMFPRPWTEVHPPEAPIQVGQTVVVLIRVLGLWWLNPCRIVYVVDEAGPIQRFGFAYGTLPGHVECGEERFTVERDQQDTVWYDLRAFSRPRSWLARLGYPLVRRLQRRFARESQDAMRRLAKASRQEGNGGD